MKIRCYKPKWKSNWLRSSRKIIAPLVFSCIVISQGMGGIFAQTVTLKERKSSLKEVLNKINKQTKLDLIGDMSALSGLQPVDIYVNNLEVSDVLKILSNLQPVNLTLHNKAIIVSKKEEQKVETNSQIKVVNSRVTTEQQQYSLVGTVTDENNNPLKGVTVQLVGSSNWASVTSDDGTYSVMVNGDSKVKFSMVGYQSVVIEVGQREHVSVKLKADETEIEETIVTAYSKFNRETFAGSANTITKKEIQNMSTPNILNIIQTLDASFVLTENIAAGSNPNAVPEASMRGVGNITGTSSNPLILLDGFQISMRELYDIDIERIQSIHILKDATATALYGSRGANGVIQIETVLPKDGKLTVSYSMMPTANFVDLSSYNLLNAKEKLEYEKLAGVYDLVPSGDHTFDYYNQVQLDNKYNEKLKDVMEGVDTYWLKKPVRHTLQTSHNLTIGGGANNVRYQLSGNYANRLGTMKGADRTTYGVNFRLEYRLPNAFTFSNQASYSASDGNNSPYGSFSDYTLMNPYLRIYDENGDFISRYEGDVYNPLFIASLRNVNNSVEQIVRNNTTLEWRPNDSWLLNATASIEKTFNSSDVFVSPYHPRFLDEEELDKKGSYTQGNGEGLNYEGRLSARYNQIVGKHIFAGQLTGELRSQNSLFRNYTVTGFSTDAFIDPSLAIQYQEGTRPTSREANIRSLGLVGSFDYNYDQRYAAQMSLRLDASSLYGKNERYQYFPSFGARWNLHNEPYLENILGDFTRFSLRATYGVSSNQNFNSYQALNTYQYKGEYYYNTAASNLKAYGNRDLKWQSSRQTNIGLELEFLNRRLGLEFDYYNKMDDGMVIDVLTPPSLGFNSYLSNLGAVRNRGVEGTLTAFLVQKMDFTIKLQTRAALNRSKLLNLSEQYLNHLNTEANSATTVPITKYIEGEAIENIVGVRSLGIDPANGKEIFLNKEGKQTYIWDANDMVVIGNQAPKIRGNQTIDIFYKNFSLFIAAEYSFGKDVYNQTLVSKVEGVDPLKNVDRRVLDDRWQNPGDLTFYKDIKDLTVPRISSRFIQTENFLNLTNVTLRYNDRREWIKKYNIVDLSYSISLNNFGRFSNVEMERGTTYPFERSITGSLRVTF